MKNIKAKSFVAIMLVIAVSSLFLRIFIERIIAVNITQNETNAQGTLKLISAASDNYAKDHHDVYPENLSVLTKTSPAYLDNDYILQSPLKGYNYGCSRLEPSGYACYASPVKCGLTGKSSYTITSGGLMVSEECAKKE